MRRFGLILITSILTAVAATTWAQVDDGLIAYWNFDACTFQDQSGNGFDDGVAPAQAPECLPGAAGNALDFAGTNGHYVRIPDVPVAPTQHSYAFWFRPATALDASSPRQDLLYADVPVVVSGNGRPHITLNHDGDGKIGFHARIIPTGGGDAISYNDIKSNTTTWEADRWYHVAFTWDGSQFKVYVDGDRQRTITKPSGTSQTYTGLVLAIRGDLQFPFQGALDDIRLYDRVLSDAEVQTLAAFAPGSSVALTVSTEGAGTGTVFSTPTAGIACGTAETDCTQSYASGTSVTLTAVATSDSVFAGWSGGGCSGTAPCTVSMDQAQEVSATFVPGPTLSVTVVGDGTVTSNPAGVDCGTTCSAGFLAGTEVTLTATPVTGAVFAGWQGACSGLGPCTVTMDANNAVTATFTPGQFPLSVTNTLGTGTGTVTSDPAGIDCGTDCDELYPSDTVVTLTPTPGVDSFFYQWGGDCSGTEPCTLTMDQAHSVDAVFALIQTQLTVVKTGTGSGTVSSEPPGINCGPDCSNNSNNYNINTVVTLTATPADAETVFTGWVGGGCSGIEPCEVTMTEDLTVTATFERLSTLNIFIDGDGTGSVVSDPPGINCGEDCSEEYTGETVITLTATPAADSVFTGWSAAECPGTDSCTVTLASALTITATFERLYTLSVASSGDGAGSIISAPPGIMCGAVCSAAYVSMTSVTLTATPDTGSTFTGWSDDSCPGTGPCVVLMTADRSVTATFENPPPVANAGPDQTVDEGVLVMLDGSQSTDLGDMLSYRWRQTSGTPVTLSDASVAQPTFTSPSVDANGVVLVFELTVTDSRGRSATDSVQISVLDTAPPVANAGPDQTVDEGVLVILDGSQSTPVNGTLSYRWVQTGGTPVTLSSANAARSTFASPSVDANRAVLVFELTVTDSRGRSAKDTVQVTVLDSNSPPVANAGANQTVDEGILVILDGSQSTPLNDMLSYRWVQISGAPVTLSNANAAQSTFTSPSVDANGVVLVFELTVTDSRGRSATDTVQVTVLDTNLPPMADAGPDQRVEEQTQATLNGTNSSDSDGAIENFVWLQMAGPPVSLSDPTSPQPVFTAPIVSLAAELLPGDTLPGFVLQPRAAGSIADVAAQGTYVNGQWSVMLTRALTTLDLDADVQFDLSQAAHLYAFSIAYLDNTGAAPPRHAAAAVMATQDTAPYTLGNEISGADLQARRETPLDCSAFTGPPLVTTPADPTVVPALTLQAAYDDVNLYLCVRAPDPNGMADEQPEQWEFVGPEPTDWERQPNAVNVMGGPPQAFDEDRIALWWNINAQDFATDGCVALCHDQRMQSRNAEGRADLWHWKAGTTNPVGLAQDEGLSADPALCPAHPCRQVDRADEAIAQPNVRQVETLLLPAFRAADGLGVNVRALLVDEVPVECVDCALAQPSAVFQDRLEFELTVTDDGGLSASDRVTVQIVESEGSDTDADGVSNAVEDQAPNHGDGNQDGVVDRRQPHVTSLPNGEGTYVTLESPSGSVLADVRAIPNPSPGNAPPNTVFPLGFLSFVIQDITPGEAATVTLYLPAGVAPTTYYKFGSTPEEPSPHWYEFRFDAATGAELAGDRVLLHLQDGQRGDDDLTANGAIMDPGAVAIATTPPPPPPPPPSGGGGGGGGCAMRPGARVDPTLLAALVLMLAYLGWRRTRRRRSHTGAERSGWRNTEPRFVHSLKWHDHDGIEYLHVVRSDDLDDVLRQVRTVKAFISASKARARDENPVEHGHMTTQASDAEPEPEQADSACSEPTDPTRMWCSKKEQNHPVRV